MTELDVALQAARAAARLLDRPPTGVTRKGAVDLVTEVDRACEAAVREVLARHLPDVPVLGEEGGGSDAPTRWVIDPLDGTTNFVHGFPAYAVSVGLEIDGVPTVGVVIDAARGVEYAASLGDGATANGAPIHVSREDSLDGALLATGFPYDRRERAAHYVRGVQRALEVSQGLRRAGAASLDLALVAAGRLDGYWEFTLAPWDVCAGIVLVREAGGMVTDLDGGGIDRHQPRPLASNGHLHESLRRMLEEAYGS